ncbi:hypothetical protein M422DRAFT_212103 [Sphaerobolus stellatus SS14]|uniref:Uncharacterized protein n=1 Tax=Sphaerobolus stellatus (strain SS14) TaxID=990650 RepID=A0A0C9VGU8_SPHS4|nr:hypothetical protein M422DRAFT_212103 [Sphaerobolus stellatus SS14]
MTTRKLSDVTLEDAIIQIGEALSLEQGWFDKLQKTDSDALLRLVSRICANHNWTARDIKRGCIDPPSFSSASYEHLQSKIPTLPKDPIDIPIIQEPIYKLPIAVHVSLYEVAWKARNVYGEITESINNEARNVRIFEAYLVPIVNLFEGRIINKPEAGMKETEISSGGAVEHELYVIGGILLILIELKKDWMTDDNVAQILTEILSAAKNNDQIFEFKNLPVYGILTNLDVFKFYCFHPSTQTFSQDISMMSGLRRRDFLREMIPITNKIFSIIFTAYIEALVCTERSSTRRGKEGDFKEPGSAMIDQYYAVRHPDGPDGPDPGCVALDSTRASRDSTSKWEQALQHALQARALFEEHCITAEECDSKSIEATKLLRQSVLMVPRRVRFEENYDLDEETLKREALEVVLDMYSKSRS